MVMRFLPAAVAATIVALMSMRGLGAIARAIAIACVVASFVAAAALSRRDVRAHATVVAAIAAVTAAGQLEGGWVYVALVLAFFAVTILSLRAARAPSENALNLEPRALAKIFVVAAAIVAAAAVVLPPAAVYVESYVTSVMGLDGPQATAFSSNMELGATTGMLQSDHVALRIEGGNGGEYLRGAVYDRYGGKRWITTDGTRAKIRAAPGATERMTLARDAPRGANMRWFLPASACAFDIDVDVDAYGVVRRDNGAVPQRLAYASEGCTPVMAKRPTAQDLEVDADMRGVLAPLAEAATRGATSPHDKLRALSGETFREFEYSLSVPRDENIDPIVDFMTVHRAGHCEMFASAMVLMARTQGIPARVVGGYRATEVNPWTKQTIVRDRDAHAWVEAWYDGAWHAYDPTPSVAQPAARASAFDHLGDLWALFVERLSEYGPLAYAAVLGVVIVVLFAIRSLTRWIRRPRRARATAALERPLPSFEDLVAALERAGFAWDPSEPLEAYATRIPKSAAAAVGAYAAFRYGGVGDEGAVVKQLESAARATSVSPSS